MKNRESLLDKIAYAMDLPGEPLPGQPIVEVVGQQRVLIEHHRGVVQYGDTEICIRVSYGCVRVCGCNLRLMRMNKQQVIISGCIDSIILRKRR